MSWRVEGFTEVRELGAGAQGRVVLARHDTAGTVVAIKYLERRAGDGREIERLRGEAVLLGRVTDPHVVRLYRFVTAERGAALIMEAVHGVPLRAVLAEHGALAPEAALTVLKGSLLGLAAAHGVGVVHRDYKPANVVVRPDGLSKLIDFGIAAPAGDGGRSGTPVYMAPEQWRGEPASPAADVYAATCVFFECVTGERPFSGADVAELRAGHLGEPPPVGALPEGLRGLVARGMAKRAEDRPPGAAAFVAELEKAAAAAYGTDWERRGLRVLAGAAVALAALSPLVAAGLAPASGAAAGAAGGAGAAGAGAAGTGGGAAAGGGLLASGGAKVAAAVVATAAVAGGGAGVGALATGDDPPPRPASSAAPAVRVAAATFTRTFDRPATTVSLRYPKITGLGAALDAKVDGVLRAPLEQWAENVGAENGSFFGPTPSQAPFRSAADYTLGASGPRLLSVRYNFTSPTRNTGVPIVVNVDLRTGRELTAADLLKPEFLSAAGARALTRRLEEFGPGGVALCKGPFWDPATGKYTARHPDRPSLKAEDVRRAVGIFIRRGRSEFYVPTVQSEYYMACRGAPIPVPSARLTGLLRPEIAALVPG
ncbi:serine/threonine-protein kinase [Spirillospora sp. NPDC127200]